ncbi:hypothetical protein C7N43_00300 [Sphingobacteriales bacterium UPWRP_1]|nr:hypothetical protein BVG80_15230 [Sphingobacteriales bacterium TSM_CSM]PSJ79099.1 hypothetical protein C7N43_00300 [Sphingobacteriales bacterium UPWRP_1]
MNETDQKLVEKYFSNLLTKEEEEEFEKRLKTDTEFLRTIFADKFVEANLRAHPINKALLILKRLGDDLFLDELPDEKKTELSSFTEEEIAHFFQHVPYLEEEAIARSNQNVSHSLLQTLVVLPENDLACPGRWLYFSLNNAIPYALELRILDNKEAVKASKIIESGTSDFEVDTLPMHPGRYYWNLRIAKTEDRTIQKKYGTATGSFWVQYHLLKK